jgi:hypothetical protein
VDDARNEMRLGLLGMNAKHLCDQGCEKSPRIDFTAWRGVWMKRWRRVH